MKSYKVVEFGKPLQKVEESNPAPQGTEVLVRVTAAGVCHSDVHLWEGFFDMGGGNKVSTQKNGQKVCQGSRVLSIGPTINTPSTPGFSSRTTNEFAMTLLAPPASREKKPPREIIRTERSR